MTLNLTGTARQLLDDQRTQRGIGLTAAAAEALTMELGHVLAGHEQDSAQRTVELKAVGARPGGLVFPSRDHHTRTRVDDPKRTGLLFSPAEAQALKAAADSSGVSMSQLVSEAVELRYGKKDS